MQPSVALRRKLLPFGLGALVVAGCYDSGRGQVPDDTRFYFPTGVALSGPVEGACETGVPGACSRWLFVASSNFDLRYAAGWIGAVDLRAVNDAIRAGRCRPAPGEPLAADPSCRAGTDPAAFTKASVRIGAFAADAISIERKDATGAALGPGIGRLLVPVRGDATLTAVDFDEVEGQIRLTCAPGAAPGTFGVGCASEWRLGRNAADSDRGLVLEGEPFAVAVPTQAPAGVPGGLAAVAHQTSGNVSLFVDIGLDGGPGRPPPARLAWIQGGIAGGATDVAALDAPEDAGRPPRFLVTNRTQQSLYALRYFPDPVVDRSALVVTDAVPLVTQNSGFDTRGIVVDPPPAGVTRPTRVFLTSRAPASLVVGQVDPTTGKLAFYDNVPLPIGPSRVARAVIDGRTLILAVSFDAGTVFVYDAESRRPTDVVRTHRGPYALAVDEARKLAYIANFTDATVQVLELDPARPGVGTIVFSIGVPGGPQR